MHSGANLKSWNLHHSIRQRTSVPPGVQVHLIKNVNDSFQGMKILLIASRQGWKMFKSKIESNLDLDIKSQIKSWISFTLSHPPSLRLYSAAGREKRKGPMISAGDAEFPRDYHTLAGGGRGARRFPDNTNGGFTSSSLDRRHNSVAAKSLEALNSIHKADIERQRDALMDLQKNKYSNSPGSLSQGSVPAGRQVSSQNTSHN